MLFSTLLSAVMKFPHTCEHFPNVVELKSQTLSAKPSGLVQIGAKDWHPIGIVYHDPHPAHRGAVILGLFVASYAMEAVLL